MATTILLKKSLTGGSVPLTTDLDQGELAINLVDRKIYAKNGAGGVVKMDGAYVDTIAPSNPVEGDLWYDMTNNLLKAHDGSSFKAAGYQNLADLEDVTITDVADNEILAYDNTSSKYINKTLTEADIQTVSGLETAVEAFFSVTDNGGDGSLTYADGVFTYTGPDAAEVRAHFSGSTGVTITDGAISIGQDVATTADAQFGSVQTPSLKDDSGTITIDPTGDGSNTGSVIVAGDLTVQGTTTSVNSNEVNIGDSIILLNSDETLAASQNAGF
jgi:hypothetical protein